MGWRVADYQLPRLTEAKPRRIDGEGLDAVGVVLGYPSHQTIAPVRVHARQRAHSGIEGGPWSTWAASLRAMGKTCNAERRWLHGLTVLVVLLSAGSSAPRPHGPRRPSSSEGSESKSVSYEPLAKVSGLLPLSDRATALKCPGYCPSFGAGGSGGSGAGGSGGSTRRPSMRSSPAASSFRMTFQPSTARLRRAALADSGRVRATTSASDSAG